MIQRLASRIRRALGPDHVLVRVLRPGYESLLDLVSFGRGYQRTINGLDTFYISPRARGLVPEVYEPPVYEFLRRTALPGWTVLSIGSHVGIYVLMLGRRVGPTGRVVAFEPNPLTAQLLSSHVRRNRLTDRVEVRYEAVAATPGVMPFVATGIEGYSRLGTPHPDATVTDHHTIEVPVTSVDAFTQAHRLQPNLMMIDVEGFEGDVLHGAEGALREDPRLEVVVEFHPEVWASGERERIMGLLTRLERRAVSLTGLDDPFAAHGVVRLPRW